MPGGTRRTRRDGRPVAGVLAGVLAVCALVAPGPAARAAPTRVAFSSDVRTRAAPTRCDAGAAAGRLAVTVRAWPTPLDRPVTLEVRDVSLRTALDRLAVAARLRLSYSAELLPLDRRICAAFAAVPAGEALATLLRGTAVEPVVAGADQIVLAPSRRAPLADTLPPPVPQPASVLDEIVVTGSAAGGPQRPLPIALDIIDGRALTARGDATLARALDGAIPGLWLWEQSPSTLVARYGSIRGASSFGVSYPKVYVDGIEVANPLLLTRFAPEAVERVEVIRGPQGAALYGSDAISGVVNIVTRHDGVAADGAGLTVRSVAGAARSDVAGQSVLAQDHAITLRAGSDARSLGLGLSASGIGEFIPRGDSRHLAAHADARLIGARTTLAATARFFAEQAGAPRSPLLPDITPAPAYGVTDPVRSTDPWADAGAEAPDTPDSAEPAPEHDDAARYGEGAMYAVDSTAPQRLRQYTVGVTGTFAQSARWTHTAVVGVDGYRLANVAYEGGPIPSATDSALRAARGGADRATLRVSSSGRFVPNDQVSATLTLLAEHSALRERTEMALTALGRATPGYDPTSAAWRSNTGLSAQGSVALREALYVTGGLRLEHTQGYGTSSHASLLPMVGAAWVRDMDGATLKLRAAYGRAIRQPRTLAHEAAWVDMRRLVGPGALGPEQQDGIEAGADLFVGRALTLHVTRFDQRASGLVQSVAVTPDALDDGEPGANRRVTYQLQNLGEITNRGWELQGTATAGPLSLASAVTFVRSRVQRVTPGYTGDLRVGDRMLEVPARTVSLTASWRDARSFLSLSLARAADWMNYDRLALVEDLAADSTMSAPVGAQLRDYWHHYDGVTRLRAAAARDLGRGLALLVTGDNLLNRQVGEPDNVTIVPGRTIAIGLRAAF
ncbi:MAG TPA: TonB-dependent receptor [Gemmatimonadaceae bacterium]|nr:TonB-dependent receptor [Gemmatimonadaceae bacterium]